MNPLPLTSCGRWSGIGSTSISPADDYWRHLAKTAAGRQLDGLRELMDARVGEIVAEHLPPPEDSAVELLEQLVADGWLDKKQRHSCPVCEFEIDDEHRLDPECPECGAVFSEQGGVTSVTVFFRALALSRDVDWVVALHGMNTRGAWQEELSWHLATTWGRSVPVAVYKYGIVIPGVIMPWRRRTLLRSLRCKLATLFDQARAQGFTGKPDVLAHSFGTWLFGHLLLQELDRPADERLTFGRVILLGCVLRPDFPWAKVKAAGLVDEVLNHYGTKDPVVPLAHATIWSSGPSGRRGFDGREVVNVRAGGYGHSDLLTITKWVVDEQPFQKDPGNEPESHLEHSYRCTWKPFLTLPSTELDRLPDRVDPEKPWRPLPWLLRGTLFPSFTLPLAASLSVLLVAVLGKFLLAEWGPIGDPLSASAASLAAILSLACAGALVLLLIAICCAYLWRRVRG